MDRRPAIRTLLIATSALVAAACGNETPAPREASSATSSGTQAPASDASTSTVGDSVVEPSTSSPVAVSDPSAAPIVLRPDGLGPDLFTTPRREVEPWLTRALGPPEPYSTEGQMLVACGVTGCEEADVLWWRDASMLVAFASRDLTGASLPEPALTSWTVSVGPWWPGKVNEPTNVFVPALVRTQLTTSDGVGLGTTATELETTMPSTEFMAWNDGTFLPNGFFVPAGLGEVGLVGDLDWNVVTDLQQALVVDGAELEVDGVAGPLTRAALLEYRDGHELEGWGDVVVPLGVTTPDPESRVVRLSAGWWWWEFDCGGELEVFGLPDQC